MTAFDHLAAAYDEGRIGYASDVYDTLVNFGLQQRDRILDVGSGTGLASAPLIENGFSVTGIDASEPMLAIARRNLPAATWVTGRAEHLPFEAASFDAAICAAAFHNFDRSAAMREVVRVVRPGGVVAIWWKQLLGGDPVSQVRDQTMLELGAKPLSSGLEGGFKEFYRAPFAEHTLRVIPWRTTSSLSKYLQYELSRSDVREKLGSRVDDYFKLLEAGLHETFGVGDPAIPLTYTHYMYLGKPTRSTM